MILLLLTGKGNLMKNKNTLLKIIRLLLVKVKVLKYIGKNIRKKNESIFFVWFVFVFYLTHNLSFNLLQIY